MGIRLVFVSCIFAAFLYSVKCLDNGVARTPPMGWLSWERFECNTNCREDQDSCISERLIKMMTDRMVEDGYRDAGYQYVNIDDCWLSRQRDQHGRLQADPARFPSGIKGLARYVHSRGMKLGIYEDVGRHTCAGFPGTMGHLEVDAQTFADWEIDLLKYDGCAADVPQYDYGYPAMGRFLNRTGRAILYSCEWPQYEAFRGKKPNYTAIAETCNTFRNSGDIYGDWYSVSSVIAFYGSDPQNFSSVVGPGSFADPDQLVIGDYGLSQDQERVQFGMWSMVAAPLLMSVDLRTIRASSKNILQNRGVIAVNQDPLGIMGKRIYEYNGVQIWTKPVVPKDSFVIAFLHGKSGGWPIKVSKPLKQMKLTNHRGYNITEVFHGSHLGYFKPNDLFTCFVNPTGIYMIKATIVN